MSSAASARLARSGRIDGSQVERGPEARAMTRFQRELHGLAHGELREQARALERAPEPERRSLVRALPADLLAQELHRTLRRHVAADRVEQRRLAGTVVADEPDDLTGRGVEVDRVHRGEPAELHRQRARREHGAVGVQRRGPQPSDVRERRGRSGRGLRRDAAATASRPNAGASRACSSRSARSRRECRGG